MRLFGTALLLFFVSAQAFAWADVRMVCRYSGRVLSECPCPPEDQAAPAVERLDCCLINAADAAPVALAVVSAKAWTGAASPFVVVGSPRPVSRTWQARVFEADPPLERPPPLRLFIRHRQLLI